ncbi:MAG: bifunctional metallophosphatase/5'-nucleotidase [Spirochaetes bacterium]|nr:bifunctional metallophosphatase/5'-nucleotidase [Spirochaetota bacterium]
MKAISTFILCICICLLTAPLLGETKRFTIIHSNDMHSHLLGFAPNIDYTPQPGDDATRGGFARIATEIKRIKADRTNPVLIIDAGDFLMGSLFHMRSRESAMELQLMREMGYEVICLGNHEFDLKPDGLARILNTATKTPGRPQFLLSNIRFDPASDKDDSLEDVFRRGIVKPYTVLVRDGIRIGLYGIIGKDAAEVAPFASPVKFTDPVEASRAMVKTLRGREKADIVIAVSHSGLRDNPSRSEDEILAKKVKGIDIIVSGHTHTLLEQPIIRDGTIIVQAGEYGKNLGVMDFDVRDGKVSLAAYRSIPMDDTIAADAAVTGRIEGFIREINGTVLREHGLSFYDTVAETDFDLLIAQDECPLGNIVSDSIRWYVNKIDSDPKDPSTRVAMTVESYGLIRDSVLRGKTGRIAVTDLFNAFPLGIGNDNTMGYPIVSFYLNGAEMKKAMEVLTSIYPLKGSDYFLQISGLKFTYNPRRMIFDRVTGLWLRNERGGYDPLDYSSSNRKLYRVAANIYNSTFLKIIGSFTMNILNIVPKDRQGNPIEKLGDALVDADAAKEGVQELKEWLCLMRYVQSFPDTDGDGVPDVPSEYRDKQGRIVSQASLNPVSLLSRGTILTWGAFGALLLVLLILGLATWKIVSVARRRRA